MAENTNIEALKELAAKIEAGAAIASARRYSGAFSKDQSLLAVDAFHGSLDAAKALHEAVLPGWKWHSGTYMDGFKAIVFKSEDPRCGMITTVLHDIPARAWLLVIIRALIVQEEQA